MLKITSASRYKHWYWFTSYVHLYSKLLRKYVYLPFLLQNRISTQFRATTHCSMCVLKQRITVPILVHGRVRVRVLVLVQTRSDFCFVLRSTPTNTILEVLCEIGKNVLVQVLEQRETTYGIV